MPRSELAVLILLCFSAVSAASEPDAPPSNDLVRSSCVHASYPNLCVHTLSSYTGHDIATPRDLARAAVGISLSRARRAAAYLAGLKEDGKTKKNKKRERAVVSDCVEQMQDSVDELSRTLAALKHLAGTGAGKKEFRWEIANAETWVSAALTDEDTCLDGFDEVGGGGGGGGRTKSEVKKKITNVARVTSNALYFINRLDRT